MGRLLAGKIAVVTGAANGIGRAIATRYAADGATVVMADVDRTALASAAGAVPRAVTVPCDVTEPASVRALFDEVGDRFGRLDVVNPNAGIVTVATLEQMSFRQWRDVLSVCLDGVFLTIHHGAPLLRASGGGAIVTTCSVVGEVGCALGGHYAAAKAGVLSLTRTAAVELRDGGIRVNAILPGWVDTDLVRSTRPDYEHLLPMDFDELIALRQGRFGTPEDIAGTALFLASDRARGCSGAGYTVDGGFRATGL